MAVTWLLRDCYVAVMWLSCGCHVALLLAGQAARYVQSDLFVIDSSIDEYQLLCGLTALPPGGAASATRTSATEASVAHAPRFAKPPCPPLRRPDATSYMDRCHQLWPCL